MHVSERGQVFTVLGGLKRWGGGGGRLRTLDGWRSRVMRNNWQQRFSPANTDNTDRYSKCATCTGAKSKLQLTSDDIQKQYGEAPQSVGSLVVSCWTASE